MLRCLGSITTPMQLKSQYVMVAVKVKFDHWPPLTNYHVGVNRVGGWYCRS